jgi:hypothetical protein
MLPFDDVFKKENERKLRFFSLKVLNVFVFYFGVMAKRTKNSQLTVCEAPCIICDPFVQMMVGTGLAPAVEHDKCTLTPDVS